MGTLSPAGHLGTGYHRSDLCLLRSAENSEEVWNSTRVFEVLSLPPLRRIETHLLSCVARLSCHSVSLFIAVSPCILSLLDLRQLYLSARGSGSG